MRIVVSALALGLLLAGSAAYADGDNSGGAYGQLQDATSGHQTLEQTYGDTGHGESCPDACPDGTGVQPPDPPPPQPDDSDDGN